MNKQQKMTIDDAMQYAYIQHRNVSIISKMFEMQMIDVVTFEHFVELIDNAYDANDANAIALMIDDVQFERRYITSRMMYN